MGANEADEKTPLVEGAAKKTASKTTEQTLNFYDRIFLKHINQSFGDHLELAFRAATFLFLIGAPFVVERGTSSVVDYIKDCGWFTPGVAIYFIFTFNFTCGQTICGASSGLLGSFLATLWMWIMFGIFPSGVTKDSPSWMVVLGVGNGVFFVMFSLFLNFDLLIQIFALATFIGLWMMFMDPGDDAFSKGFTLSHKGAPVSGMIVAFVGVSSAVIVSMVPYPFWAMDKARGSCKGVAKELCESWESVIDFYCADAARPYETSMVMKNMRELCGQVDSLAGHVTNAWWECFAAGKWGKARTMLTKLDAAARENYDRLVSCLAICMQEDFKPGTKHVPLMEKMKPALMDIVSQSKEAFNICVEVACVGFMTSEQHSKLEKEVEDIGKSIVAATQAFQAAKKDLDLKGISFDMNDEHAFCLSVCAFGRLTVGYGQCLIDDQFGGKPLPPLSEGRGFTGIFDSSVVLDKGHMNLAMRNSISILTAFLIGYFGYYDVVPSANPAISITAVLMMSSSVCASITKNLGSVQGVVLGTVVGRLVWSITGWCTWWGYILLCLSLFFWNFVTLYIRFDSPTYGGIGCLLAAFGSGNFLLGCIPAGSTFDTAPPYYSIINVIVAIFLIIFVDMSLSPGRASDFACNVFRDAVKSVKKSLDELLDPSVTQVREKSGKLGGQIAGAKSLGSEAWDEPRYWRVQWKNALFNQCCQTLADLRVTMTAMEYSITLNGAKTEMFLKLLKQPDFQTVKSLLYEKFQLLDALYCIFEAETSEPLTAETAEGRTFNVFDDPRLRRNFKEELEEAIHKVMAEINSEIEKSEPEDTSLERDTASCISFCLSAFLMMMDQLDNCQQAFLME